MLVRAVSKRLILKIALLLSLLLGLGGSRFFIAEQDPELIFVGPGYRYKNHPATGIVYELYGNHRIKHLFFLWQGALLGTEYAWYDTGALMAVRSYKDGLPHGVWKMWYEDGSAKSWKPYLDGEVEGEVWGWHPNGQVSDFNFYQAGRELTHKSWVSDGTPYYNYVYQDGKKLGLKGGDFCKRLEVIKK